MVMKKPSKLACHVLAAVCACSLSPFFVSQASAADPVAITDMTNTTWRTTDGSYTFRDGLDFTFDGSTETSRPLPDGGISVFNQTNNAERVIHAEGNLSITQKNGHGPDSEYSSAGAYVRGDSNEENHITPSQVTFTGNTIHLTGLFNGTPSDDYPPSTYGLYIYGEPKTEAADERNARVRFDNANTYLTASYQSAQSPTDDTAAHAVSVDHAAEAVFNGNAYLTTTLNEHGDVINGSAVHVVVGKAAFNGNETSLNVTSQNTENNRTIYGVDAQGYYTGTGVRATPYELVRFNSPTTDIAVTANGKSSALGVYTQVGDVNFTNNVRNLSIDANAAGEGAAAVVMWPD